MPIKMPKRAAIIRNSKEEIDFDVVKEILHCAETWEPDATLIGNVRAGDIAELCRAVIRKHFGSKS